MIIKYPRISKIDLYNKVESICKEENFTYTKDGIENLLSCQYRFTFYEFMRDVFFISRILSDRRPRIYTSSKRGRLNN